MQVHELMTKQPVACAEDCSLRDAARLMRQENVGCLIVMRGEGVSGICTDRDLVLALAEHGPECIVADAMSRDVTCVRPDDSLMHVIDVFRSAGVVRRLPVVDSSDRPIGLISLSDVAIVAEDLVRALFLEERTNARAPHRLTGAKELVKRMRRPAKADRMPQREPEPVLPMQPR